MCGVLQAVVVQKMLLFKIGIYLYTTEDFFYLQKRKLGTWVVAHSNNKILSLVTLCLGRWTGPLRTRTKIRCWLVSPLFHTHCLGQSEWRCPRQCIHHPQDNPDNSPPYKSIPLQSCAGRTGSRPGVGWTRSGLLECGRGFAGNEKGWDLLWTGGEKRRRKKTIRLLGYETNA